ncbi:MAG: histidine-type phosphatase, partial [Casimicrobiaceae bacterium]
MAARADRRLRNVARRFALALSCCCAMPVSLDALAQSDGTLLKAVIVSRHGVRTPTLMADQASGWTTQPWPSWEQPRGALTAKGLALARLVGGYQRDYLAAHGLLPARGCPAPGQVYVYADVEERTQATAQGLVDGLAPGCALAVHSRAPATVDGVFHPVAAKVCRIDGLRAQIAVLSRIDGGFAGVYARNAGAFDALQRTFGTVNPALCALYGKAAG